VSAKRSILSERSSDGLRRALVKPGPVLGMFASLTGSQLGGALLGLAFWTIATRALIPAEIGIGASLVAAMALFSMLGALGTGTLLLERFKVDPVAERRALLSTGYGIAATGAAAVSAGWLVLSALVHIPGPLGSFSPGTAVLLMGATAIAGVCSTFDLAVLGMGAGGLQLRRNLVGAALRIVVFLGALAVGIKSGEVILVAWAAGLLGSLFATPLRRRLSDRTRVPAKRRWDLVRSHWTVAIGHHSLTLAVTTAPLILPVLVASIVPATQVAYFAQASLLANTVLALLYFLTVALFASVEDLDAFRQKAVKILVLGVLLALAIITGGAILGRFLLLIFGSDYARNSMPLLMIILAGGPAILIKDLFVVLRRLQGLRALGAKVIGLWSAAELLGAAIGGLVGGLTMLCLAWLATTTTCALLALPVLLKAMRRQPTDRGTFARLIRRPAVMELAAHVLCAAGIPLLAARRQRNKLAIIMFHGIEPERLEPSCSHVLDVATLRRELKFVRRHFRVMPLDEALESLRAGTLPARAVALTFDDGTRNLATHAAPVLRSLGLPAAVFLVTGPMGTAETLWPDRLWLALARTKAPSVDLTEAGLGVRSLGTAAARSEAYAAAVDRFKDLDDGERIGQMESLVAALDPEPIADAGPFRLLSWDEADTLAADGRVTLHPHSVTHPILARCPDDKVANEIFDSCDRLERATGRTPTVFAYPNGRAQDFDGRARVALRRRGVGWALSTTSGFANSGSDPLALPRIPANSSFAMFRLQVSGALPLS
jgi:peptidoglycan/xylan/chitin deacetylase (PgdA/CDA1 family)/O-antigen/teichoic acid export membrane protein